MTSLPKTPHLQRFLEDESVPAALKRLYRDVIPGNDLNAFREMVASGDITPAMQLQDHKLCSPLNMVMSLEQTVRKKWLAALFEKDPAAIKDESLKIFTHGDYSNTNIQSYDGRAVTSVPLLEFLRSKSRLRFEDLIEISPDLLSIQASENGHTSPYYFLFLSGISVEQLEALERKVGHADFINLKDDRGETLFYKIVSTPGYRDERRYQDAATWMLMKNPALVNDADRLGWTPLDRHVTEAQEEAKNNDMLGLLIAAGAKFNRQLAPDFNVTAEIEKRSAGPFEKAPMRKGLVAPSTF